MGAPSTMLRTGLFQKLLPIRYFDFAKHSGSLTFNATWFWSRKMLVFGIISMPEYYDYEIGLGNYIKSGVAPELENLTLFNFGFVERHAIRVPSLHFPSIGSLRSSTNDSDTVFRVLEKTREFTPEETAILFRIDGLIW